jgi:hypothetical protein
MRAHLLHELRGDGVLGKRQAVAQRHGHVAGRLVAVRGAPHLLVAQRDLHGGVHQRVGGQQALVERGAVHKGLEGGARLAARGLHMVERVLREVAAAHPGAHLARARVHGHETGLHARLLLPQRAQEGSVASRSFSASSGAAPLATAAS